MQVSGGNDVPTESTQRSSAICMPIALAWVRQSTRASPAVCVRLAATRFTLSLRCGHSRRLLGACSVTKLVKQRALRRVGKLNENENKQTNKQTAAATMKKVAQLVAAASAAAAAATRATYAQTYDARRTLGARALAHLAAATHAHTDARSRQAARAAQTRAQSARSAARASLARALIEFARSTAAACRRIVWCRRLFVCLFVCSFACSLVWLAATEVRARPIRVAARQSDSQFACFS